MFNRIVRLCGVCVLAGLFLFGLWGCSQDANNQADFASVASSSSAVEAVSPPADRTQFVAELETLDLATGTLTFVDHEEVVIADEDCIVVSVVAGVQETITLADLVIGDMVKVCGFVQEDGSILANRLTVYSGCDASQYDLAFRDEITSIDYEAGTFTVMYQAETITTDENTVIWTVVPEMNRGDGNDDYGDPGVGSNTGDAPDIPYQVRHAYYEFGELEVGDVVEVRAFIIDENTLLAASIKLANSVYRLCIDFDATLTAIDYDTRMVSFAERDYESYVCAGADLHTVDGDALTLEDFAVDDAVHVRGYETDEGYFKVSEMTKL